MKELELLRCHSVDPWLFGNLLSFSWLPASHRLFWRSLCPLYKGSVPNAAFLNRELKKIQTTYPSPRSGGLSCRPTLGPAEISLAIPLLANWTLLSSQVKHSRDGRTRKGALTQGQGMRGQRAGPQENKGRTHQLGARSSETKASPGQPLPRTLLWVSPGISWQAEFSLVALTTRGRNLGNFCSGRCALE